MSSVRLLIECLHDKNWFCCRLLFASTCREEASGLVFLQLTCGSAPPLSLSRWVAFALTALAQSPRQHPLSLSLSFSEVCASVSVQFNCLSSTVVHLLPSTCASPRNLLSRQCLFCSVLCTPPPPLPFFPSPPPRTLSSHQVLQAAVHFSCCALHTLVMAIDSSTFDLSCFFFPTTTTSLPCAWARRACAPPVISLGLIYISLDRWPALCVQPRKLCASQRGGN